MKKVLIVAAFANDLELDKNSRIFKIKKMFENHCYTTKIITSDFSHREKKYKSYAPVKNEQRLHVPSYQKNLSLKRIWSHLKFAYQLKKYLNTTKEDFDLIYCAMPTSSSAVTAGKFAKKNSTPFIIDVIDIWPNSLIPIYQSRLIKIILLPWYLLTHKAYQLADFISAESKKYAEIANSFNQSAPAKFTYLGINKEFTESCKSFSQESFSARKIKICYGGSLGNSYDFESILKAIKFIHDKNIDYEMEFIGDGELRSYIEGQTKKFNLNISVTGRVDYKTFLKKLHSSDIAINSFKENTTVVHSYKFNDYVATGCFILNNLKGETADIVNDYKIGLNYQNQNLSETLFSVCSNWKFYNEWKKNTYMVIETQLDDNVIYGKLMRSIEEAF